MSFGVQAFLKFTFKERKIFTAFSLKNTQWRATDNFAFSCKFSIHEKSQKRNFLDKKCNKRDFHFPSLFRDSFSSCFPSSENKTVEVVAVATKAKRQKCYERKIPTLCGFSKGKLFLLYLFFAFER